MGGPGTAVDIRLSLGLDGLSLWFFGLTTLLMVVSVLVSWQAIVQRPAVYYGLLLLLESGMLGVFAARDIILFYVCFEFTLLPLLFLIGVWGSEERRYAAVKFFLFTFTGSMLTFLGLLAIVLWNSYQTGTLTFSIAALSDSLALRPLGLTAQTWIFLALFAGFAVKVPLFPLHTWLPLAHVQAPAAGSVLLAGVLLKVGSYGFLRFCLPMVPGAVAACMPWLLWLSVIGIVYGALVSLVQDDMKRLIAYSSVSHLGFCMLGVFALNPLGAQGGTLQMINHGLSTGGLFALVGMIYERYHTRKIADLGGLAKRTPVLAFFFLVMALSSIGLPGLNGFAGEFTLLVGDVPPRLGRRPGRLGRPVPRNLRAGHPGRGAGSLVHALVGAADLLRSAQGAPCYTRRATTTPGSRSATFRSARCRRWSRSAFSSSGSASGRTSSSPGWPPRSTRFPNSLPQRWCGRRRRRDGGRGTAVRGWGTGVGGQGSGVGGRGSGNGGRGRRRRGAERSAMILRRRWAATS